MKTLEETAIDLIPNDRTSIRRGVYRYVKYFTYRRRKYVIKADRYVVKDNGGCKAEAECWNTYKNRKSGSILAPVIAHGELEDGRYWLVMSKLQTIGEVYSHNYHRKIGILKTVIFPRVSKKIRSARMQASRISCTQFGDDLHYDNWGMDNRGNWFCFDYSKGGN